MTWFKGLWGQTPPDAPRPIQDIADAAALQAVHAVCLELLELSKALDASAYHLREAGKRHQASLAKQAATRARTYASGLMS